MKEIVAVPQSQSPPVRASQTPTKIAIDYSDRIMHMSSSLQCLLFPPHKRLCTNYAARICNQAFCEAVATIIRAMPEGDKCIILGDFNARRGRNSTTWPSVLGPHSMSKANSNRHLLPSFCAENKLTITNSYCQLPNELKTTWTHARSGHWHLTDCTITRGRDISDFCLASQE
jgi:hypothetical protein